MEWLIVIMILLLIIALAGSVYANLNMIKKGESQDEFIELQQNRITDLENFIQSFSDNLSAIDKQLKEVDNKKWFESDDEVGFTFQTIKLILTQLQQFNVNYNAQEEKR